MIGSQVWVLTLTYYLDSSQGKGIQFRRSVLSTLASLHSSGWTDWSLNTSLLDEKRIFDLKLKTLASLRIAGSPMTG